MDMVQIRRRWGAHVRALPIPIPFDVDLFCLLLGARRGRPIALEPSFTLPPGTTGRVIHTATKDIVLYDGRATGRHRLQIILHELGHLICGHQPPAAAVEAAFLSLVPKLAPTALRHTRLTSCERHPAEDPDEIEAEGYAALVLEEIDRRGGELAPVEADPGLRGYTEFFGW